MVGEDIPYDRMLPEFGYLKIFAEGKRSEIFLSLAGAGESGMSFKKLSLDTSIPPTLLAYHLKRLQEAELVIRDLQQGTNSREYTRYRLTERARRLMIFAYGLGVIGGPVDDRESVPTGVPDIIRIVPAELYPRVMRLPEE
ncbi:MAG TPA: ArsR family transcriptional regulator [Euryarchaeota archaeon]|nr:ArsR family transcriptional regulator [Euryarchaeota archaeon]